ncbi:alpha/beta hydrolase [Evansella sp. AB-P1]|nr:alpha/beta hydrolase [Evansella sp. AB-P1]MDG5787760.1 alpha/beta hydrolase [Evansella sp. AB-P1]
MWKWEAEEPKGVFVIIHGAGEYHVRYEWVVNQLHSLGYHVIIGDLPGQGKTEGPRGHVNSFNDYKEVLEKWLSEGKKYNLPVVLLGHSMGGLISIYTLQSLKEVELPDVVILSSPCLGLTNPPKKSKKIAARVLNVVHPSFRFPSGLAPGSGTRDERMRQRDLNDSLLIKRVSVRWYSELEKAMDISHRQVDSFPNVPLLVMQGGNDLIVDKEKVISWFNRLPIHNKYYKEWDGLYHEVLNEPERNKVLAHLLGFVTIQLSC